MNGTTLDHRLYLRDGNDVSARRNDLFRETLFERCERLALGAAYALKPERAGGLPALALLHVNHLVARRDALPDPGDALDNPPGLCGIVRDLSAPTLLAAYRRGLHPGGHVAPEKWFSPPERCVLFFQELRIEKSLRKAMRKGRYTVTFDRDFEGVIKACAGRRPGKWRVTWITPRIMHAYSELFDAGYAHSYEVWNEAGELAGGGYGVAIGGAFFGESQFSLERNTSKIGQTALAWHLARWGFLFDDSKHPSPMLINMGCRNIPRDELLAYTAEATRLPGKRGPWETEGDLAEIAEWEPRNEKAPPVLLTEAKRPIAAAPSKYPRYERALLPVLPAIDHATLGVGETLLRIL
jgi:leucyl/phenylalanyl-tRNA--protein transferase